jgi:hypothetical protein
MNELRDAVNACTQELVMKGAHMEDLESWPVVMASLSKFDRAANSQEKIERLFSLNKNFTQAKSELVEWNVSQDLIDNLSSKIEITEEQLMKTSISEHHDEPTAHASSSMQRT